MSKLLAPAEIEAITKAAYTGGKERSPQADVYKLLSHIEALNVQIDALLAHCPDGECETCSEIICPHKYAMHFHHDGCPACAEHEAEQEQS